MREANRLQTELAAASLDAGCLVARRELKRRYGELEAEPLLTVLGLGRLGGGGMDYGSDLDVVLVYDDAAPSPVKSLDQVEAYARFGELLVAAISSITRDGYLYRVDLRLRPDGRNGPACSGANAFLSYLQERALAWEWLAYVKLRSAAGQLEFGARIEREARRIIHERAQAGGEELLRRETRRVRERLEMEKFRRRGRGLIDIKYGPGGMLDLYFATRYLQLRDRVPDDGPDRSTQATLAALCAAGSLRDEDYEDLSDGYAHLRALDHFLRLIVGRSTRLPSTDHPALSDIAVKLGYASAADLVAATSAHMLNIRAAYDRITKQTMNAER
jgi:glutamate-ammonia-ligase adenylyltransferase